MPITPEEADQVHVVALRGAEAAAQLARWAATLDGDEALEEADGPIPDRLLGVYALAEDARRNLAHLLRALDPLLHDWLRAVHGRHASVVAGHTWEPQSSRTRSGWDNDELRSAVRRTIMESCRINPATGEVYPEPVMAVVSSTMDLLAGLFRLDGGSARITALRDLGIDVDDFCRYESRRSVRLLPATTIPGTPTTPED